jgi:indolepyruvate ferredoxin oxidoreductase, alpha subunit
MSAEAIARDAPGEIALLLGNEAIARGVLEAGVAVAAAYPGTPSSEIVGSLAQVAGITGQHVEWSTNEKVAFECAAGAAFLGVRAFCAMKSVGLNVAMDPLMVINLTGIKGGFVFLVADDPNCWSTQNEQDSRLLAHAAEIPCLEPSSVQEAKDMVPYAYDLSEEIGRPVMIRTVTRVNHSRAPVTLGPLSQRQRIAAVFEKRAGFPALPKHRLLHHEEGKVREALSGSPFNQITLRPGAKTAIVASGNAYNYAIEASEELELRDSVSFIRLGVVNPLPKELLLDVLSGHERVFVFEEIEPFIETQVRAACYEISARPSIHGKASGDLEIAGELDRERVLDVLSRYCRPSSGSVTETPGSSAIGDLIITRDTVLCAGCPHMGSFHAIRKALKRRKPKALIAGDIGCYGLGVFPPYELFDSHICMGASIGIANGYAASGYKGPIVAVIGDSTFFHSGIPALINAVINKHRVTVLVLDNAIIGMTGHQPAPGTGWTAKRESTESLDIAQMVRACGVRHVSVVDPFDVKTTTSAVKTALDFDGPAVVVSRGECALMTGRRLERKAPPFQIDEDVCNNCGRCVQALYCPALNVRDETYGIDEFLCAGCGICAQVCPRSAIAPRGKENHG